MAMALKECDLCVVLGNCFDKLEQPGETEMMSFQAKMQLKKWPIQSLDYQHRDASGRAVRTPDSLTNVFYTAAGREVRDGGGIRPDVEVKVEEQSNLLYYLLNDDILLDYGTEYARTHETIASPQEFELTDEDYSDFKKMVIESGFKYDRQSEGALKKLKEIVLQ